MPASLLTSSPRSRGVTRNESTRSDSSVASNTSQSTGNKKVSFNKAVRVKKYSRPKKNETAIPEDNHYSSNEITNGDESPGKRFWFKVYKNKYRQPPDPNEFRGQVIYYGNDGEVDPDGYHYDDVISYHPNPSELNYPTFTSDCGTQTPGRSSASRTALLGNEFTPLHPSQMPTDPPSVRKNHVKKIVNRFNEEAVLQQYRTLESEPYRDHVSPPGSPMQHSTPIPVPPPPPPPNYTYSDFESRLPPPPEGLFTTPRTKKNPIVNGVKVMFGIKEETKNTSPKFHKEFENGDGDFRYSDSKNEPYKNTEYYGSETSVKTPYKVQEKFLFGDNSGALVKRNGKMDAAPTYRGEDDQYQFFYDEEEANRAGRYHVETWDSGNELVFDTTDVNTSTGKTDNGHYMTTVGEKHQLWRNNKRMIIYEEPSPTIVRRKAKSQSDLTQPENKLSHEEKLDKVASTEDLYNGRNEKKGKLTKKDSWFKHLQSQTKDKGIQCNKVPIDEPEELYGFGRYKIIKPRNGMVTAFSNVENLKGKNSQVSTNQINGYDSKDSVIYSQVDKSKKKKKNGEKDKKKHMFSEEGRFGSLFKSRSVPLYIGPPPKSHQPKEGEEEVEENVYFEKDRTIKTSKKSFGFNLNNMKSNDKNGRRSPYYEEDWYNVDGDIEAMEYQKRRSKSPRNIAEIRQEIAEEEISDASSLSAADQKRNGGTGSVMREVDYKKREISYENVPRSDGESNGHHVSSGLWYRDANEDYRKEMAQNEVSYPAGKSVGNDRFYTIDRKEKSSKKLPPPSPRAYTLDRRHLRSKEKEKVIPNTSGVKILVNGKEMRDKSSNKKYWKHDDPSSVQSDPVTPRGGLAAAYQARQRAAVRRSNSSVSGLSKYYSGSSPNIRRIVSSDISAASSESESSRHRRPLVMYIPGVSHPEKASEKEDRVSSTIARSQSMMSPTRPPRMVKRTKQKSHKGSKTDLYRNGDVYYEEDEIMPLTYESSRKKPPKTSTDSKKDIKRRHSMPKDNKFSWLKWKLRGKPSREP